MRALGECEKSYMVLQKYMVSFMLGKKKKVDFLESPSISFPADITQWHSLVEPHRLLFTGLSLPWSKWLLVTHTSRYTETHALVKTPPFLI